MQNVSSSTVTMKTRRPSHRVGTKVTGDKVGSLVGSGVVLDSTGAGVGFSVGSGVTGAGVGSSVGSTVTMMGTGYMGTRRIVRIVGDV